MKSLEKFTFHSLLFLIVLLPIPLGSNRIWAWSLIAIYLTVQSFLLLIAYRGKLPTTALYHYRFLLVPIGLFQLWVVLQTLPIPLGTLALLSSEAASIYASTGAEFGYLSLDSAMSKLSLFKGLSYTLFAINAAILVNESKRLKLTATALVFSATLQAFYGAFIVLIGIEHSPVFGFPLDINATGSFVYKNHLANYLVMSLCIGIGLIVTQLHVSHASSLHSHLRRILEGLLSTKMFIRLCLVVMVIALVMTRSRMGNTAFFAATTIGGLVALIAYKHRPPALTALVLSVIAIDTLVLGSLFGLEKVKQRLVETSFLQESRDQVVIWALDIIRDFPITGTGMASFYSVFPMYSQSEIGFYDHAHNDYVQFLVEAGIPATLLLVALVLICLWRAIKVIKTRHSRTMKGIALGSLMAIIGMLIHMSVDFNLQPSANAFTFVLVLFFAHASYVLPARGVLSRNIDVAAPSIATEVNHV
ncbi:polymerase [Vibrio panuliri]|uniref:Polymerase n=1 Tax=Vibrio panuliri TaxID=1381081 RepID=A0A1Q9HMZ9_9VIBR|nr:O-antigen ligase family protein [Vibrio panuliri]OLQ92098.1 polymerase [Vibrio panuliri]